MNILIPQVDETVDDFLFRLGSLKESDSVALTWPELAEILNNYAEADYSESHWRKRYRQMRLERDMEEYKVDADVNVAHDQSLRSYFKEIEKRRIRARDERMSYSRLLRSDARQDAILDLFREEIQRAKPPIMPQVIERDNTHAVYAMLSDIHYGLKFENYAGYYDSEEACQRVMRYAGKIVRIGEMHNAEVCYVSLMGDMISGNIHTTIRIENKENIIEQVIGVSELVASFLYYLGEHFESVIVNSVSGNHSRLEQHAEDSLRADKLDALIPWYCKVKLEQCANIAFSDNLYDPTIGRFKIFEKTYVSVHGDMDSNLKESVQRIEHMTGANVDYILAAHLHVPEMRLEHVGCIRNGSVCGSGDEYTMKKRLFSPPMQVCMVVNHNGVESVCPVML